MRDKRDSFWDRWNRNKLCSIDNDINTNMYISQLRISEGDDKTILNNADRNRGDINRGIYGDGHIRVLYIIRGGIDTDVLYNRSMRGKRAEDNSGILFFLLYIIGIGGDVNKYNVYIYDKWDDGLRNINGI